MDGCMNAILMLETFCRLDENVLKFITVYLKFNPVQGNLKTMKLTMLTMLGMGLLFNWDARGQNSFTNNVNASVPDGSPVGLASVETVSGLVGAVTSISVNLDITGGFNGDLYAYLVGPQGGFTVLLNRSGLTGSNPFGYSDTGFNITLSDGSPDIHSYQTSSYSLDPITGQLNGTWAPDGSNIDPQSAGSLFSSTSPSTALSLYDGSLANGSWTLFIADLSSGGQSTLVSWGLTISTVPEPQTWLLGVGGGLGLLFAINRRRNR